MEKMDDDIRSGDGAVLGNDGGNKRGSTAKIMDDNHWRELGHYRRLNNAS